MKKGRRNFPAKFKANVAIEAVEEWGEAQARHDNSGRR